jgi:glycosyltransferase involved in cell wall biosynthesis
VIGTEPIRLAYVVGPSDGGIGVHVRTLVRALSEQGGQVTLYCPPATEERFDFAAAGADVTPVEITAGPGLARLRRGLRADGVDVVHAHGLRAGLAAVLTRPPGAGLVVTWHSPALARGVRRYARDAVARRVARGADVTLCASVEIQKEAVECGARDARLMMVVAPPLPPPVLSRAEIRAELGVAADAPMVLAVGRLHEQKRHDLLVAAASRWRDLRPLPAVVIAGVGPTYRELVAQIAMSRAPVSLIGHRDDVADLLAATDLAVVSSDAEGSPLFVQEVLASGTALVATAVNGVAELAGGAAMLVPPGDVDALDRAVRGLLGDPQRRAVLGAAGRAVAAGWPAPADTIAQITAVYDEVKTR